MTSLKVASAQGAMDGGHLSWPESAMRHAVILTHPRPDSLTASAAEAYARAACEMGHEAQVRDLYRLGFDPCLKACEIPGTGGYCPEADVAAERAWLADADVFAFVYPLWFNAPPAMLKGYVDRVFSAGFGYAPTPGGATPLLAGRRLISFTFSGAPADWLQETGARAALLTLFDHHLCAMSGMTLVDHVHQGGIVPGMTPEAATEALDVVRRTVRGQFGQAADQPLRRAT